MRKQASTQLTFLICLHTDHYKQDGISLLYACLQHFLDRKAECPKAR